MSTMATTVSNQPGSKRWTHFHSALQLAIQRASHKWTYEDFGECFSLWCDEQPDGAVAVFGMISRHMENAIAEHCEGVFAEYKVKDNIDVLHAVVTEARARKQGGEIGVDVWREDLQPMAAVRARTVPVLQSEAERLRMTLEQLEKGNQRLQAELQETVNRRKELDDSTGELLDIIDEVYENWSKLPSDEIETWTVQAVESSGPPRQI